ncbi:translocon-associated protein subunit alpha [Chironomus tepperi]|uniref:translocon-associated protein subunit alpha n=1 Tax=Chironomus tepperi TaxID=113505 RepID=UPI00391F6C59
MKSSLLLILFVLPTLLLFIDSGNKIYARAEDEIDEDLVDVENEGDNEENAMTGDDVEPDEASTTSPDADTHLLFVRPLYNPGTQLELPGGVPVEFLIGFMNKGKNDFIIESVEASFRYPMDFNYYIQNFSAIAYNREVKQESEATVSYSFMPSESFAGRPFGLNIAINYRDSNGSPFVESVFNETVLITELDEGLDGETFFLYVFFAAIVVLLLVVGQQFLGTFGKKKRSQNIRKQVETGTSNNTDIDYDWLPAQTLRNLQSSPKGKISPKQSPRQRSKRAAKEE